MDQSSYRNNLALQTIGDFLFQKRIKDGFTLREFSIQKEVDAIFVSKLERNKLEITDDILPHISKLYNVSVEDLKNTNWDVDKTINHPLFVPAHIDSEEKLKKLLNFINDN